MTGVPDPEQVAFVQVRCTDMEDYARIFNEGFTEAQSQCEADVRTAGAAALKEAAAEQRRLSEDARTNNGQAEHEDIADWLEERADAIPGRTLHCPVGCEDGVCETCPCCSAGFCVYGLDGLPEDPEDVGGWIEVAAAHNPVAALLAATQALLLAAHPAEPALVCTCPPVDAPWHSAIADESPRDPDCQLHRPAPVVTDEAVEAAALAMFADEHCDKRQMQDVLGNWNSRLNDEDQALYRSMARAALEAAAPLLGPRPLLDREALREHLRAMAFWAEPAEYVDETAAAVMELAWPMPTLAAIEQRIRRIYIDGGAEVAHAQEAASEIACAVLFLLNGAES